MSNLNLAGLVLAVLFIALILTKKEKLFKDYLLAFFIFLLGTFLLIKYVFEYDLYNRYPVIIYLDIYYWVLLGPALYLYTLLATRGENHIEKKYLLVFIPAVLVTLCFWKYLFLAPREFFIDSGNIPFYESIGVYIWMFNSPVFYVLTIIALYKHRTGIKHHFSFTKKVDLNWLFYLSHGFAIFLFFLMIGFALRVISGYNLPVDNYPVSVIVTTIYIFGIGFYGYKQRGIFDDPPAGRPEILPANDTVIDAPAENGSYKKSGLGKEEAIELRNNLESLMVNDELFLEPELDLPSLASNLGVSTHKLSQVINEYMNRNFFDFVNEYRLERVKTLLSDPANDNYKIESLAYESGFNSRSTFYGIFKKSVGATPAEYRKKYRLKAG